MSEAQATAREDYQSLTPRGEVTHLLGTIFALTGGQPKSQAGPEAVYSYPTGPVAALVRFAPQEVAPGYPGWPGFDAGRSPVRE